MKNFSTKILLIILALAIIFQFKNLSYAQNIPACSSCHNVPGGQFSVAPVDLNNCNICHANLIAGTCDSGTVSTPYGNYKSSPPDSNGNVLHSEHAGINNPSADPSCQNCHIQTDCNTCHTTVNHNAHFSTDPSYLPRNLTVANGTSVYNKDFNCANSLCHNTIANSVANTSRVLAIDSQTYGSISIDAGDSPKGIAVNNNTNRVYITNYNSNTVTVIDSDTSSISFNQAIGTISVGNNPYDIAVNVNTNIIYVTNTSDNTVSIIDGSSNLVIAAINVGLYPRDIEVNSATNEVYVANYGGGYISVINPDMGNQVSNIFVTGIKPQGMYVDSVSNKIYLGVMETNPDPQVKVYNILVIDGGTKSVTGNIANTGISNDIVLNAPANRIYSASDDKIVVIDSNSLGIMQNININNSVITSVAIYPEAGRLYAAVKNSDNSETLYVLNSINDSYDIINTIQLVKNTQKVRVNNNNGYIYISGGLSTIVPETNPSCFNCHTDVSKHSPSYHDPNPRQTENAVCNLCHNQTNLIDIHSAYNWSCVSCHVGMGPNYGQTALTVINVYKTISNPTYADKAGCQDCHPNVTGTKGEPISLQNSNHITLHDPNPRQTENAVCNLCHSQANLSAVHTAVSWDCLACHNGTGPKYGTTAVSVINAYALSGKTYADKAGCQDCHPTVTGTKGNPVSLDNASHYALHDPNPRQTENTICNLCHTGTNLAIEHKNNNWNCDACHLGTGPNSGAAAQTYIAFYMSLPDTAKTYDAKAGCQDCHSTVTGVKGNSASLSNSTHVTLHIPNPATSTPCNTCHNTALTLPELHKNIADGCLGCHSDTAWTEAKQAIAKYHANPIPENRAGCTDCHGQVSHTCVTCHEEQRNARRPVTPEFGLNSHHVAGVVSPEDCMSCHNTDNHGSGIVYLKNIDGEGTIAFDPNDADSLNPFCLGCHDADSKNSVPFTDGKKPISSGRNWDSTDIETKYSNTGTADSNKYPPTQTPPGHSSTGWKYNTVPNEKKAYSPHGNPAANQPNGNTSDKAVPCFGCHNSHGSSLPALIKTTDNYLPSSIEDFCWDCHLNDDVNAPYKASDYLNDADNNIVRDYTGDDRWGKNDGTGFKGDWMGTFTYKNGRFVSSHFYPSKTHDSTGIWQRNPINCTDCHDPHGVNSSLTNAQYMVPILKGTWLISPYKEDRAPMASFESQMNDPYFSGGGEPVPSGAPQGGKKPRANPDLDFNNPPNPGGGYPNKTGGQGHEGYFIDANTFGAINKYTSTWIGARAWDNGKIITSNRITEDETKFAGLCLKCHNKTALKTIWGGHGVVKGWGGASKDIFTSNMARGQEKAKPGAGVHNMGQYSDGDGNYARGYRWDVDPRSNYQQKSGYIQTDYHQFVCSKCHSPHASRLPRLMITNCIDTKGNHTDYPYELNDLATNCHDTNDGAGWNNKTPWIEPTDPVTTATVDTAQIVPSSSTVLTGESKTLTFMAKNNKTYTLKYFTAEFSYNYSVLDISNLNCTPPARIASIDANNRTITLRWENINPRIVMMATFDCKSDYTGNYEITKSNIEYKDENDNVYYGTCNNAVINVVDTIPDTQSPSVPANLRYTSKGRNYISLAWNASTDNVGVTGYNIYRKKGSYGTWSKVGTSQVLSYNDTGLSSSTTYYYKVSAYDAAGNESAQSSQISVTTSK
ncbi:MAG: fibronectin type III domain-containing protein [bacterium]